MREPRYAVGLLAGAAYFAWIGWILFAPTEGDGDELRALGAIDTGGPVLLVMLAAGWWTSGRQHMALAFTPAEVHFLFQAPIQRRTLLHFKLVRAQLTIAPLALLFTALARPFATLGTPWLALGLWGLMSTAHLHQIGSGLLRSSWGHQGSAALRRHRLPLLVLLGSGVALAVAFLPLVGALRAARDPVEMLWAFETALAHPAAAVVLMPFHVAVAPLAATTVAEWGVGMAGLLGLLALHYVWVVRADTAFEELAAQAGVELQELTQAFREGRLGSLRRKGRPVTRPWFRLAPEGHPAVAIFWKNFTQFTRNVGLVHALSIGATFFGFWVILLYATESIEEASYAAASLPGVVSGLVLVMGPLLARNDLRTDMTRLESVRTYPVTGRALVAAEIAASAASLTLVVGFFLTTSFVFLLVADPDVPAWVPWAGYGAALLLLPLVATIALGVQNVLSVVFPAWVRFGPTQSQGLDQTGEMMVGMLVSSLLLLGLLAPLIFAAMVAFRLAPTFGVGAAWVAGAAFVVTLVGEIVAMVTLLGEAWDRLDPAAEGLLR